MSLWRQKTNSITFFVYFKILFFIFFTFFFLDSVLFGLGLALIWLWSNSAVIPFIFYKRRVLYARYCSIMYKPFLYINRPYQLTGSIYSVNLYEEHLSNYFLFSCFPFSFPLFFYINYVFRNF